MAFKKNPIKDVKHITILWQYLALVFLYTLPWQISLFLQSWCLQISMLQHKQLKTNLSIEEWNQPSDQFMAQSHC